jgi:hypothetical protein
LRRQKISSKCKSAPLCDSMFVLQYKSCIYMCVYIYICKYSTWFYMQSLYYIWTMKNTMVDWLTSGLILPNLLSGSTSPGAAFHLHQRNEVDPGQCLLDGTRGTRGRRETAGSWLAAGWQIPFMPWRC